jgi:type VI protein secretion system component VasF
MYKAQFNTIAEAFLMQSQNGQNHGIYVWSVFLIVVLCISIAFIFYKQKIKAIAKKIK